MQDKQTELIDKLLGFDSKKFQQQMTEGLEEWHRKQRERDILVRSYVFSFVFVAMVAVPTLMFPRTTNYRLDEGATIDEVVAMTNSVLGI
ncbi:MAG: hypothetical protein IJQ14_02825 [Bacteroidales bacterium]|nr:hypothetical protein [Bacteroidales bacterium]